MMKTFNYQKLINDKIKNPDAIHKFNAYSLRLYNKYLVRKDNKDFSEINEEESANLDHLMVQSFKHKKTEKFTFTEEKTIHERMDDRIREAAKNDLSRETRIALESIRDDLEEKDVDHNLQSELSFFFKRLKVHQDDSKDEDEDKSGGVKKANE